MILSDFFATRILIQISFMKRIRIHEAEIKLINTDPDPLHSPSSALIRLISSRYLFLLLISGVYKVSGLLGKRVREYQGCGEE